ncbi:MAG: ABC transporter ATP-binding protein [Candidatus Margulisiibacteriota bacterium]
MPKPIIEIRDISKRYRIGAEKEPYLSLRDEIAKFLNSRLWNNKNPGPDIWALKNVSFNVEESEIVGIIGKNGAGKSTLLKILSRITPPAEGSVIMRGRVGSLLEVGTGFHQELTGRENIYLNGTILGMTRKEIDANFDKIVAFADIGEMLDTPVKRYSSGMFVRLAFAVAAHLESEILLIDEVLAVGDADFQKKCLGKIDEVSKVGRTILFVSHNMASIRLLCNRCVFLDSGQVKYVGDVSECINRYMNQDVSGSSIASHFDRKSTNIIINSVKINGSDLDVVQLEYNSNYLNFEIEGELLSPLPIDIQVHFNDIHGTPLAIFFPGYESGYAQKYPAGKFKINSTCELPKMTKGEYILSLHLVDADKCRLANITNRVLLRSPGTPSCTGKVIDYNSGEGWILLPEKKANDV